VRQSTGKARGQPKFLKLRHIALKRGIYRPGAEPDQDHSAHVTI